MFQQQFKLILFLTFILFKNDSIQRLKENFNYVNLSFQRKYEGGMNASFDKKPELTLSLSLSLLDYSFKNKK